MKTSQEKHCSAQPTVVSLSRLSYILEHLPLLLVLCRLVCRCLCSASLVLMVHDDLCQLLFCLAFLSYVGALGLRVRPQLRWQQLLLRQLHHQQRRKSPTTDSTVLAGAPNVGLAFCFLRVCKLNGNTLVSRRCWKLHISSAASAYTSYYCWHPFYLL